MNKKFRIGDKVRLIDEAAECEVSQIISDNRIIIRDPNGFEYTVSTGEIVPLFDAEKFSTQKQTVTDEVVVKSKSESLLPHFRNTSSLFLCAVPENFDSLLNTPYKISLVNSSEEILLYSMQQHGTGNASYGILNPKEEFFAGTFSRINKSAIRAGLTCIIHSDGGKIIERQFSLTPEDFTNEKLFHSRELFVKHILSFDCFAEDEIKIPEGDITKLVDHFSPARKKVVAKEKAQTRTKTHDPNLFSNDKTVDLHIEELTDSYTHMSNAEIITLQLSHFHKELDSAILNHYYRIIFIHGKGNGVLRGRIRSELDAMNLKYRDADTSRFGFGATEVLL